MGVDSENEGLDSHILHQFPSICTMVEGRKLVPNRALPDPKGRILYSAKDLNTGSIFHFPEQEGEPNVASIVDGQDHPYVILHWILVDEVNSARILQHHSTNIVIHLPPTSPPTPVQHRKHSLSDNLRYLCDRCSGGSHFDSGDAHR